MSDPRRVLEEFLERYGPLAGEDGPVRFVREVWGVKPDRWQEEVLAAYGAGERRLTIRPWGVHGPLRWKDLQRSAEALPRGASPDHQVEWVVQWGEA